MNVRQEKLCVTPILTVVILLEVTTVNVDKDLKKMDSTAQV